MLGFIVGGITAITVVKLVRRWRRALACGGSGAWHLGGACRGVWRRRALRSLLERLGTMPGQERAILAALDRLGEGRADVIAEMRHTRDDVAHVLEGGLVDDRSLDEAFARHDRLLAQLRVSWLDALKTIAEALDERQRRELATVVRGGRLFGRGCGPGAARDVHPRAATTWEL